MLTFSKILTLANIHNCFEKQIDREKDKLRKIQSERDRQIDRQIDREREKEREIHNVIQNNVLSPKLLTGFLMRENGGFTDRQMEIARQKQIQIDRKPDDKNRIDDHVPRQI